MQNHQTLRKAAFEKLFRQFIESTRPKLFSFILRLLSVAEAEEVLQEAHIKFYYIALKQVDIDPLKTSLTQFTPLLFSIAKNLALSRVRHQQVVLKHQRSVESNQASTGMSAEFSLLESDEKERLQAAITSLPPMCKQVFIQRKIHNKSHADIAKSFNITTKTVESHIARGLKLCREHMISSRARATHNTSTIHKQRFVKGGR